jgi:hypothetical protein
VIYNSIVSGGPGHIARNGVIFTMDDSEKEALD